MKKLIAMVAIAAGLMLGSVANAAQVDLFLTQTTATDWELTANNNGAAPIVAVNLLITGLDSVVFSNPNTNGSFSSYAVPLIPPYNWLIVDATGSVGPLTAGSTLNSLLATLSVGTGTGPVSMIGSENPDLTGSDTVFSTGGAVITDYTITVTPLSVPEPATMVLLGLGLAALGFVRRSA